jgi:hypothetical protein
MKTGFKIFISPPPKLINWATGYVLSSKFEIEVWLFPIGIMK